MMTMSLRGVELCVVVGNILRFDSLPKSGGIWHWLKRGGLKVDVMIDGEIVRGTPIYKLGENHRGICMEYE